MNDMLSKTLDALQARMFFMNKKSDRISSVLKEKFSCFSFSELFHNDFAHFWSLKAADRVVEIKDLSGVGSEYPAVEESTEDFESIQEMFSFLYDITVETKESVQEAIEIAEKDRDIFVKLSLEDFIVKLQKVVYSAFVLNKKAKEYSDQLFAFDAQASIWYVRILDVM